MGATSTPDAKGAHANDAAGTTIRAGDEATTTIDDATSNGTAKDVTASNGTANDATAAMGRIPTASGIQCQHWVKYNWTGDGQCLGGRSATHS